MNIWKIRNWEHFYDLHPGRKGIRVRYDKNVDSEVKRAIHDCIVWLRSEYKFPKRVNVYVKGKRRIRATNGDKVCGTFFRPADREKEPYIKLATGDYHELLDEFGKDNALAAILNTMIHELTHYFQWLNDLSLTLTGEERQATIYASRIIGEYAQTRDHP